MSGNAAPSLRFAENRCCTTLELETIVDNKNCTAVRRFCLRIRQAPGEISTLDSESSQLLAGILPGLRGDAIVGSTPRYRCDISCRCLPISNYSFGTVASTIGKKDCRRDQDQELHFVLFLRIWLGANFFPARHTPSRLKSPWMRLRELRLSHLVPPELKDIMSPIAASGPVDAVQLCRQIFDGIDILNRPGCSISRRTTR